MAALGRLFEPFNEFPYATPEACAAFVSHVLTAVLRTSFDTSPVFCYSAPGIATGKTLLAAMPCLIAAGNIPANSPYSEDDELRKVLFASLLAGDPALLLDNVPSGIKVPSPHLCAFSTSPVYSDRVLGLSETRKVPNRATVILTGNNITPSGDLSRRSLVVRLDANAESARGRTFRIADLKGYVRQHRAQLIVDALTIVRAYAFAGWPTMAKPLESFAQWSRIVRDPLMWLGMADAVKSQEGETEDELTPLRTAFDAIATATQAEGHTFKSEALASMAAMRPDLREALKEAGCSEPADGVRVRYWLRAHKDRVAAGWKLKSTVHANVARWQLKRAGY
jgi:hypothetical protein